MIDFAGAHVVVTGSTGTLGTAVVGALRAAGAVCYIPHRGNRRPDAAVFTGDPDVRFTGGVDLGDETAIGDFYRSIAELWGAVHLAGSFAAAPIAETSVADFDAQFRVNARSCFLCTQAAVARIRARSEAGPGGVCGGRIVNVSARPALEPRAGAGMVAYTAAKAAVAALTQALAEELAPEQIWVNAVAPSTIDTPANRAASPQADFRRWVAPESLATVIAFLASPENRATRGAVLPVYGGS